MKSGFFKFDKLIVLLLLVFNIVIIIVFVSQHAGIWKDGIKYLVENEEKYTAFAFPDEAEYSIPINLKDLESNKGEILLETEEGYKIYVKEVIVHDDLGYEIIFRTKGIVGLDAGGLVTGIEYRHNSKGLEKVFQAKGTAKIAGTTSSLKPSSSSGLIHRDGDEFGFYFTPQDGTFPKEAMEVTITNLFLNFWLKNID